MSEKEALGTSEKEIGPSRIDWSQSIQSEGGYSLVLQHGRQRTNDIMRDSYGPVLGSNCLGQMVGSGGKACSLLLSRQCTLF